MYLEAYLNNVADDDTKVKYSSVLPDTADQIYSNFKTVLKEECDRPLFVAVYTELWIYKDPPCDISNIKKYQKTVKWILVCFTVFLFPIVKFSKRYCL